MDIAVSRRDDIRLVMGRAIGLGHRQQFDWNLPLIGSISACRGKGNIGVAVGQEGIQFLIGPALDENSRPLLLLSNISNDLLIHLPRFPRRHDRRKGDAKRFYTGLLYSRASALRLRKVDIALRMGAGRTEKTG